MHPYVIKFVGDLRQVGGFLRAHRFLTCHIFRIFQNLHLTRSTTPPVRQHLPKLLIYAYKQRFIAQSVRLIETSLQITNTCFISDYNRALE
jgi:hypothetical protein